MWLPLCDCLFWQAGRWPYEASGAHKHTHWSLHRDVWAGLEDLLLQTGRNLEPSKWVCPSPLGLWIHVQPTQIKWNHDNLAGLQVLAVDCCLLELNAVQSGRLLLQLHTFFTSAAGGGEKSASNHSLKEKPLILITGKAELAAEPAWMLWKTLQSPALAWNEPQFFGCPSPCHYYQSSPGLLLNLISWKQNLRAWTDFKRFMTEPQWKTCESLGFPKGAGILWLADLL